jgi:hypothetical protein
LRCFDAISLRRFFVNVDEYRGNAMPWMNTQERKGE